jgi:hypothetical protein
MGCRRGSKAAGNSHLVDINLKGLLVVRDILVKILLVFYDVKHGVEG